MWGLWDQGNILTLRGPRPQLTASPWGVSSTPAPRLKRESWRRAPKHFTGRKWRRPASFTRERQWQPDRSRQQAAGRAPDKAERACAGTQGKQSRHQHWGIVHFSGKVGLNPLPANWPRGLPTLPSTWGLHVKARFLSWMMQTCIHSTRQRQGWRHELHTWEVGFCNSSTKS